MIKVSFILDTDPKDVDLSQALDAMHASVDDIAGHFESVDIFVNTQRMDETMCVEEEEEKEEKKSTLSFDQRIERLILSGGWT